MEGNSRKIIITPTPMPEPGSTEGDDSIKHEISNVQQEYGLIKGVKAHVNFDDKSYAMSVPIIQGKDTTMGITLLQIHNPSNELTVFGGGIRFNFSEELRIDTEDSSYYKYTDEVGKQERFKNQYYYKGSSYVLSEADINEMTYDQTLGCYVHGSAKVEYDGQTKNGWRFVSAKEMPTVQGVLSVMETSLNTVKSNHDEGETSGMATKAYYLRKGNQIKVFNTAGYLIQIGNSTGQFVYIVRENGHKILRIFDHEGREITFEYSSGKLQKITDSRGREILYTYDGQRVQKIRYRANASSSTSYESLTYNHHIVDGVKQNKTTITSSDGESATLEYTTQEGNSLTKITYQPQNKTLSFLYTDTKVIVSAEKGTQEEGTQEEYTVYRGAEIPYINEYKQTVNGKITAYNTYLIAQRSGLIVRETKYPKRSQLCKATVPSSLPIIHTVKNDRRKLVLEETQENIEVSPTVNKDVHTTYTYNEYGMPVKRRTVETYSTGESYAYVEESFYNPTTLGLQKKVSYVEGEEQTTGYAFEFYTYDSQGRVIKTKTVRKICECSGDCTCKGLEDSTTLLGFVQEQTYDEHGNVVSKKDETGLYYTAYTYTENTKLLKREHRPGTTSQHQIEYTYDERDRLVKAAETATYNVMGYTADNVSVMGVKNNEQLLQFTYDTRKRLSQVSFGGSVYEGMEYGENETYSEYDVDRIELNNANVEKFKLLSDVKGAKEWYFYTPAATEESPTPEETLLFTNEYDEYGQLVKLDATVYGDTYHYDETYEYDETGRLTYYDGDLIRETYTYNNKGQISQIVYTGVASRTETREYTDDSRGLLERISYGDVACWKTYDKYGRLQYQGVELNGCYDVSDIKYKTVNDHETNQVQEFRNSVDCFTYTYDKNGNITEIYNWGNLIKKYTYSIQGRLTTEENLSISQKTEYTYSQQGDITQKTRYIKDFNGNYFKPTTKTYTYSTDGKYLLTAYNGSACVYDALGNPTTYKGKTLVWGQGKRLLSYDGLNFTYDARGRRIQKGSESYYYDSRDRLVRGGVLDYYYADNEVISCAYNGVRYIYCKDVFGNITAILDENENVVVKYDYDAWGNHRVLNSAGAVITDTQHIGHKNPFRYRGYYYDTETGLYYLKSRYYDPETCRFINMDSVEYADPTYLHGLNLYAYCNNNPIMYVDPNGNFFWLLVVLGLGAVAGGILSGVEAYNSGDRGWELAGDIVLGATIGVAVAGAAITVSSVVAGAFGQVAFLGTTVKQAFAIGALAYNGFGAIVAPLIGQSMQLIEIGGNSYKDAIEYPVSGITTTNGIVKNNQSPNSNVKNLFRKLRNLKDFM